MGGEGEGEDYEYVYEYDYEEMPEIVEEENHSEETEKTQDADESIDDTN